jgi:hypothetical protein
MLKIASIEWRRLWPAAVYLTVLTFLAPVVAAACILILAIVSIITRNLFAGIGLAVVAAPFGWWLIEHPRLYIVLLSLVAALPVAWCYRREIRSRL